LINISVISWWSVLLVEETYEPEKTTDLSQVTDKLLSHNVVSSTPCHERGSNSHLVVIDTDYTGSCKSNYHAITTRTVPVKKEM
jgi:hypothetical protein